MEIHKPKPWHGWREFLKEYLIIVVGVLTALAAEQAVEWLHWRHQVEVAQHSLSFDLKRAVAWAGAQEMVSPCVGARLDEIEKILEQAQATGRLPEVGRIPRNGRATWTLRSWAALTSSQVLGHMSNREQISLAGLAVAVDGAHKSAADFDAEWQALRTLAGPARTISGAEVAALRRSVFAAREQAFGLRVASERIETFARQTELLPEAELVSARKDGVDTIREHVMNGPMCRSLPTRFEPGGDENSQNLAAPMRPFGAGDMDTMGVRKEPLK
jgi:hypothetical protein